MYLKFGGLTVLGCPLPLDQVYHTKCDMQNLSEFHDCFSMYHHILFHLTTFLPVGMVFPKYICHTHGALNLSLHNFNSNLQTFPQ